MKLCKLIPLALVVSVCAACGSDSGSIGNNGASIRISSDRAEQTVSPGGLVAYTVETENFTLAAPFNLRSLSLRDHPADVISSNDAHHGDDAHAENHETAVHDSAEQDHHDSDDSTESMQHDSNEATHDHNTSETNQNAREGHYHIYLDAASGSDAHVTSWEQSGTYQLPINIAPGTHTLRFELRDNNHVPVGTPASEAVLFFNVQ